MSPLTQLCTSPAGRLLLSLPARPLVVTILRPVSGGPTRTNEPPKANNNPPTTKEFVVKFKSEMHELGVKGIFKKFYTLYGPLFVASHIGVSLVSLGSFCALTYTLVDPAALVPEIVMEAIGDKGVSATAMGGKFIIAYGIHKFILPLRLVTSIVVTQRLARLIGQRKK